MRLNRARPSVMEREAFLADLGQWTLWFAWRPVTLDNGDVVWMDNVERRLSGGTVRWDEDGIIWDWEYRRAA